MSEMKLLIDKPYRVVIPEELDSDKLRKFLSYRDKSVYFELQKIKKASWYNSDSEWCVNRIRELEVQKNKCLLKTQDGVMYTYSGLAKDLSSYLKLPIENEISYPKKDIIPWLKVPDKKMRPYQKEAFEALLQVKHSAVSIGCHRKGEKILMFDGLLKSVEDILVDDKLMGPDSQPRIVQELKRGYDSMYEVSTINGQKMTVNGNHVLHLRRTNRSNKMDGRKNKKTYKGRNPTINITVNDYLKKSNKFKHLYKLYSTDVDFSKKEISIAPYFLGLLLGDGSLLNMINITTMDEEIVDEIYLQADLLKLNINKKIKKENKASTYEFTTGRGFGLPRAGRNPLKEMLRKLGLFNSSSGTKFIPDTYKINSKEVRYAVLAGLIDSDGHYVDGCYDFISKSKQLAEDVSYVARSLGLRATIKKSFKKSQTMKNNNLYWRVYISGDTFRIPTRLSRKQARKRLQKKNPNMFGFTVEKVSDKESYFGFVLDKDHLYLTDSFLITHNTGLGKSLIILHLVKELGLPAVIMAPSKSIANQLYDMFVEAFGKRYVGMFGSGKKQFKKKFVIAIAASLSRLEPGDQYYDTFAERSVFIADESHLTPAKTLSDICLGPMKNAPYRFFFSATQMRTDGAELLLKGIIGPIVYNMTVAEGVEQGYLAKPIFKMLRIRSDSTYSVADANKMDRKHLLLNPIAIRNAAAIANRGYDILGKQTLILIDEFEQAALLDTYLTVPREFAHGGLTTTKSRGKVRNPKDFLPEKFHKSDVHDQVRRFNNKEFPVLIGTSAIGLGTDIQTADVLVFIQKGVSEIKFKQGVGRGTRKVPGKDICTVFDFDVENIRIVHRHALRRADIYESIIGEVEFMNLFGEGYSG